MALVLSVPVANQLQVVFLNLRDVYEIRERSSRIYSWPALVTSQILVELPWNIVGSTLFFFCWYWTVGFPTDRGGYTYLLIGVLFPIYYTTIGQAVAATSPTAEIAGILFSFLFSFVLTFNGVVQPYSHLGWWQWMYRASPYTYLIEGLVSQSKQSLFQNSLSAFLKNIPPRLHSSFRPVDPMCRQRVCRHPTTVGLLLRVLPRSVRRERWRVPSKPGRRVGLPVLLREHRRHVALPHVQYSVCASLAGRGLVLRVHRVQRECVAMCSPSSQCLGRSC